MKSDKKKRKSGKVIRDFTVEVCVSDPLLDSNPSNPYTKLSSEERLRDFIEMFSLLWAESCRDASKEVVSRQ